MKETIPSSLSELNVQLFREACLDTIRRGAHDPAFLPALLKQLYEGYIAGDPNLSHIKAVQIQSNVYVMWDGMVKTAEQISGIDQKDVISL